MKVTLADDNVRARIHLGLLRLYGAITAVASHRGSQTFSWKLGRLFPEDDAVIVEIFEGKKICVHLNDGYWTRLLFDNFVYEPEVEFVLNLLLGPGSFFLDCGSNIGYWSIFASKYINFPEQIVAVEPSLRTFARLERNRVLNGGSFTVTTQNRLPYRGRTSHPSLDPPGPVASFDGEEVRGDVAESYATNSSILNGSPASVTWRTRRHSEAEER